MFGHFRQRNFKIMFIYAFLLSVLFSCTPSITLTKYNPLFSDGSKPSYPFPGKLVKNMNLPELAKVLEYGKIVKDSELVFKVYAQIFSQVIEQDAMKVYRLDVADYCFSIEDYEKASIFYDQFYSFYPGSNQSEYAQYKSILCSFYLSLSFDRDQTLTNKTIAQIDQFLLMAKEAKFIEEIKTIRSSCRQRLFDHEVYVFESYLRLHRFISAQHRLDYISTKFTDIKNIEAYSSYLAAILATTKDVQTQPFVVKVDLNKALKSSQKSSEEKMSALRRITSFFLA